MTNRVDCDATWRTIVRIEVQDRAIRGGNDGPPELDRHLPAELVKQREQAIQALARELGVSTWYIENQAWEAVDRYLRAPGTDADPDHLASPRWDEFQARGRGPEHEL